MIKEQQIVLDFFELYLTKDIIIHVVNEISWYAKQLNS